jgi:50S ribosomal protein L16 3-hydroxylase
MGLQSACANDRTGPESLRPRQNAGMDVNAPLALLGGLTPAAFMKRHWQKKPLLVRQAWPGVQPPLPRPSLFDLAARDDVESRLVACQGERWTVRHGPMARRALPPLARPGWTLLVQGVDLHVAAARQMLERFRFLPDARVDDLMISWASPGGGVGPHIDDYDVFLIQVHGKRRWRVGRVADPSWVEGAPLKRLQHFEPSDEWVLEPGDLLYLPPRWGHDGIAEGGDCMTCSAGFSVPAAGSLSRDLLSRLADEDGDSGVLYRDAGQPATETPAAIPSALLDFARQSLARQLAQPLWLERALGESLTEPKAQVWFEAGQGSVDSGVCLDARTRMMYDLQHVFINGEAFRAGGRDAKLMRRLADERGLPAADVRRLSADAAALLQDWLAAGWLHGS